jgi:hypothetical protein
MKHKWFKWGIAIIISLLMAIGITTCHAQDSIGKDSTKRNAATTYLDDFKLTTDAIGQVFFYNNGHDIIVKYNSGEWGPIHDSLTALNAVFDKYAETLTTNRGYASRIQYAFLIAEILYYQKSHPKLTKEQRASSDKDLAAAVTEYSRLSKLYP